MMNPEDDRPEPRFRKNSREPRGDEPARGSLSVIRQWLSRFGERHPVLAGYLNSPVAFAPFTVFLLFLFVYSHLKNDGALGISILLVVAVVLMVYARLPRWLIYGVVLLGMMIFIYQFTMHNAYGTHDSLSDRDDAVEIGASALLEGDNPWNRDTQLGTPVTTGPSNMVLSLPVILLTGNVNFMTFLVWLAFAGFLLAGDLSRRNNSFLPLCLLMLFPFMNFIHTWTWSLDELFYAAVFSPLVWLSLSHRRFVLAGFLASYLVFARVSYVYAVLAIGLWWMMRERRRLKEYLRLGAGALLYAVPVLTCLLVNGGDDFVERNFVRNSQSGGITDYSQWIGFSQFEGLSDHTNWLVHAVSSLLDIFPSRTMGSAVIIIAVMVFASLGMRTLRHPFFHIGLALFLAHTIAFSPVFPQDYMLIWVIPVMYGIAYSAAGMGLAAGSDVAPAGTAIER